MRAAALLLAATLALQAHAEDAACQRCHAQYAGKKYVHAALQRGCASCHAGVDSAVVPHKGAAQPSAAACYECHERESFEGRFAHAPVEAGACVTCHDPHASDHPALGRKAKAELCLDCHVEIGRKPHVLAGLSGRGHPLGVEPKTAQDPLRPGSTFYCGSCHDPHGGAFPRLTRFDTRSVASFCLACHKM